MSALFAGYIDGVEKPCMIGAMQNGCNGHITYNDTVVINKKLAEIKKDAERQKISEQIHTNYAIQAPLFMVSCPRHFQKGIVEITFRTRTYSLSGCSR